MNQYVKYILCVILLLTTAGCASSKHYKTIADSATHIDQLMRAFGPPVDAISLPDGKTTYIWRSYPTGGGNFASAISPYLGLAGGYAFGRGAGWSVGPTLGLDLSNFSGPDSPCEISALADKEGYVISWRATGDNCNKILIDPDADPFTKEDPTKAAPVTPLAPAEAPSEDEDETPVTPISPVPVAPKAAPVAPKAEPVAPKAEPVTPMAPAEAPRADEDETPAIPISPVPVAPVPQPTSDLLAACLEDRAAFHLSTNKNISLVELTHEVENDCLTLVKKADTNLATQIANAALKER